MFRNHDEILRLDFVKLFETEIVPFFKDPDLQEFVLRYKLFYILLIFLAETEADIKETVSGDEFPFGYASNRTVELFMEEQVQLFQSICATLQKRDKFISQVIVMFETMFDEIVLRYKEVVFKMFKDVLPPTCTVSETIARRLQILGLFGNHKDIIHYLQSTTVPSNYGIRNVNPNRNTQPYILNEFKLFFPRDIANYKGSQLEEFEKYIWKTHVFKSPCMQKKFKGLHLQNIDPGYTPADIILQIFVFSLDNWEAVWAVNFPCSPDVVRRLYVLKYHDNWKPDPKEITIAILKN